MLQNDKPLVEDLFTDLRDGEVLLSLLEILTAQQYVSITIITLNIIIDRNKDKSRLYSTVHDIRIARVVVPIERNIQDHGISPWSWMFLYIERQDGKFVRTLRIEDRS